MLKGWWQPIGDAVHADRITLITSPQAIEELLDVLSRPRFVDVVPAQDALAIADLLRKGLLFNPTDIQPICRDVDDDFLLALAIHANADVLVSRDEDLLSLGRHGQTEIIHVAEFLQRLHAADT